MVEFSNLGSLLKWVIDHRLDHTKIIQMEENYDDWTEDLWEYYREIGKDISNPITLVEHHDIKKLNMEKAMELSEAITNHASLKELYEDLLPEEFVLKNGIVNIAYAIDEIGV